MGRYTSVVLFGHLLVAAALVAQGQQLQTNGTSVFHVSSIELARVPGKPISFKSSAEMVRNPGDGKLIRSRTEVMWARDSQGRIYYDVRSSVPAESDQIPQLNGTIVLDPIAGTLTGCWPSLHTCYVSKLNPPGQARCSLPPAPDDFVISWVDLGEENVSGIAVAHTREICTHRGGGPGPESDFWRNSRLGIELSVYTRLPKRFPWKIELKLGEVSQTEPEPQLFALPIGFAVQDAR